MQGYWLHKKNTSRCILFMAGWGMGPEPFFSLAADGCDLFICYDYRELTRPDMSRFCGYKRLELVAWSMGVWVAANVFAGQNIAFAQATALGGTLDPIDDQKGVPVAVFDAAIETLDAAGMEMFYASMFDEQSQAEKFADNRPRRSVSSALEELVSLRESVRGAGAVQDIYTHKIVTMRDRIFPARNQVQAWGKQHCTQMKWPHFPFYKDEFQNTLFFSVSEENLSS